MRIWLNRNRLAGGRAWITITMWLYLIQMRHISWSQKPHIDCNVMWISLFNFDWIFFFYQFKSIFSRFEAFEPGLSHVKLPKRRSNLAKMANANMTRRSVYLSTNTTIKCIQTKIERSRSFEHQICFLFNFPPQPAEDGSRHEPNKMWNITSFAGTLFVKRRTIFLTLAHRAITQ